jgi:catechol 2,3-dioxygenase-like lactoylglutathione lyase family enzyme
MPGEIAGLALRVSSIGRSTDFYRAVLGMTAGDDGLLRFGDGGPCLELLPGSGSAVVDHSDLGYWKIGVTVPDLDQAHCALGDLGVLSGAAPRQFEDIGRLFHIADPDGYCIEFLERERRTPGAAGLDPVWAQITFRTREPDAMLAFYRDRLGMRLLAVMPVPAYRFTLYFLSFTGETPPDLRLEAKENRPWLWNRPYLTLEFQHRWGTEQDAAFRYGSGADAPIGFDHLVLSGVAVPDGLDPDGYRVKFTGAA